jgi:hypothetical protein
LTSLEEDNREYDEKAAFSCHLAKESGNALVASQVAAMPGAWMRTKAALGRAMLSVGARFAPQLERFQKNRIEQTVRFVGSVIENARRGNPGRKRVTRHKPF